MTVYSSLSAVSDAVYTVLNVAALTALAPGGVSDEVEQLTSYPCVLYEVQERQLGQFGSRPGSGQRTMECDLRLHVFTQTSGFLEAHGVMAKCIELLATPPAVTGYGSWAIFHDETIPLPQQLVAAQPVNELVGNFRLFLSEGA